MQIRTIYFKVLDMQAAINFWQALLKAKPIKQSTRWSEFKIGATRLGLLLNDFGEQVSGSGCVPVFALEKDQLIAFVELAKSLGAIVVFDGLDKPEIGSIVLEVPTGHEFEVCHCHD
ncbi:VOC family protein [Aquirhabdus parva]|uniref:VOC family protein n=1 Tax=Aquirhabdus parva TaxID=2283318 RepID=A0A345P6R5_9GAMM|nr:VOC family protein [Aquirhabdus parva]AXI02974.1 VOC family protein [Aquirhabdus parva]